MKVVSILELQAQKALPMFAAHEGPEAYASALNAAITTNQTAMALFLERELGSNEQAEPTPVQLAVQEGLTRTQSEWLAAVLKANSVAKKFANSTKGQATYESALAAQSAKKWRHTTFAAARTAQIAMHWLDSRKHHAEASVAA